jgi:hypothetical protein
MSTNNSTTVGSKTESQPPTQSAQPPATSGWSQGADYNSLLTNAKSDLAASKLYQALIEATQAIVFDQSRWEAYTVAAGAAIKRHRCNEARDYVQKAIARAPEGKKQGLASLVNQCSPDVSSPLKGRDKK